jgi:hypothetical protein
MIAPIEQTGAKTGVPIYQIEVFLSESEPLVRRRLQVPGNANLGWLHAVLQVAMGWTNSHLHQFVGGEHVYSDPTFELEQYEGDPPVLDERLVSLRKVLPAEGDGLFYGYDFGDSWEHLVRVTKILPAEPAAASKALCLEGAGACPPEDCGGIGGYMNLLKVLKNPKHREHKRMKQWLGRPFDPEAFDVAKINKFLGKLKWPRVTDAQLRKVLMARDGYHE